jgi:hypothetical protein
MRGIEMSELSDIYKDHQELSKTKRAANREFSPKLLDEAGIKYTVKNNGAHLIIWRPEDTCIDFWPGTGKWIERPNKISGRGVKSLINFINNIAP